MTAHDSVEDFLAHDPGTPRPVPARIVTEWEPGTFIETLAPQADGSWLVTIPSHNRVDRVAPDGSRAVFAELDRHPTGIVTDGGQTFVLAGTIRTADWQLVCLDPAGRQTAFDLPDLVFGNGMAQAGTHLYAVDSARGLIVRIDPVSGESGIWAQHSLLTGPHPDVPMPGANGITIGGNGVYVSNTGRGLLLRFALDDPAAEPRTIAQRLVSDNIAWRPDGRIFLATHFLNTIVQLDPDGTRLEIAGPDQGIAGSTSAVLDPRDPDTLYVTTTGGMNGLADRTAGPARLIRLSLRG